jgi:tetrahydromethanopterin S-methyltransferase subunit G
MYTTETWTKEVMQYMKGGRKEGVKSGRFGRQPKVSRELGTICGILIGLWIYAWLVLLSKQLDRA